MRLQRLRYTLAGFAAVAALSVAACSSSAPATASSILKADGYTAVPVSAQDMGNFGQYASSVAVGTVNGNFQLVAVVKPGNDAYANATVKQAKSYGLTASYSNSVFTMTGTEAQFQNLPG